MEIIPAIDIIDGKCVRLTQGDFARRKVYCDDPLEMALRFQAVGVKRLHLVDLDGAKNGRIANLQALEKVAKGTDLIIDFGGGIKSNKDLDAVFDAGASFASIGSVAARKPAAFFEWIASYGGGRFLLGADVRGRTLAIDGWQTDTELEIISFLAGNLAEGAESVFVTDVTKDGLLSGPSTDLYQQILQELPRIKLIASGGIRSLKDIDDLKAIGCAGVIIGKAIYEGRIALEELGAYVG